jgi:hypothetical protein
VTATYRVGKKLGTTIYRDDEYQPCAWVPNNGILAAHIVVRLNGTALPFGESLQPMHGLHAKYLYLGGTAVIYRGEQLEPCVFIPGDLPLARRIVDVINGT